MPWSTQSPDLMVASNSSPLAAVGRVFNDLPNSPYLFPADAEEGRRLDDQHEVIKCSAGGKLLMAPVKLDTGDKVLDCAAGTGLWLLELASMCPMTVSFHGIDISTRLFPRPESAPPNVTFSQHSVLDPPPAFSSSFTLVNQRLLIVGLSATDWPAALRAHFQMLRPGGWVQLCEIHFDGFSRPDGVHTARVHAMVHALLSARGLDSKCAVRLEHWARDAGFVNVGTHFTHAPVGVRAGDGPHNYTKPHLAAFLSLKDHMLTSGIVATAEEYEKAVQDMETEWNDMDDSYYPFSWLWGQKPDLASIKCVNSGAPIN